MGSRDVELDLIGRDHTGHATHSAASNLDQLERKMGAFNARAHAMALVNAKQTNTALVRSVASLKKKLDGQRRGFARSGIDAARAFSQGFIRTISLGMLGRRGGGAQAAAGMSKVFGPAGVVAGLVFGAKLLAAAGDVILAGLPLILGPGIAALPFVHLWKGATENLKKRPKLLADIEKAQARVGAAEKRFNDASTKAGKKSALRAVEAAKANLAQKKAALDALGGAQATEKAVSKLKTKWKGFADFVSKPMKLPFVAVLKEVGKGLDHLRKPFASLVKDIGPALKPFTRGVFDGVVGFVKALKPAMPGITAGLKAWGTQLPVIGKAFGDMLAKLLKDPKRVTKAIENTSKLVQDIITLAGDLTAAFLAISDAFTWFDNSALGLERASRSIISFFSAMAIGVVSAIDSILTAWATINPLMRGPAAAVHAMLLGMQAGFEATKRKWAETDAEFKKRQIVAKITATIDDLNTKIAAAKAKLKTVHNAKARAKIEATIKDLQLKQATAKALLHQYQGTRSVAKLKADKKDLETKIAAAKASLKTVHNSKTRAKIKADIAAAQAALRTIQAEINALHGKTVSIKTVKTITTRNVRVGGNPKSVPLAVRAAGVGWEGAAGGSYRTGGPRITLGDTNVDTRVFIDGAQIRATARSTVIDENRRAAHRARVGRR